MPPQSAHVLANLQIVEYVFETVRAVNHDVANVSPVFAEAVGKALSMLPNPMFTEDTVGGCAAQAKPARELTQTRSQCSSSA